MQTTARLSEIRILGEQMALWIDCPIGTIPDAGQYLVAADPLDAEAALGVALFPMDIAPHGFLAAPPVPRHWGPGMTLQLRGPLGRGFSIPAGITRLALAALGDSPDRLMPLLALGVDTVLFTDTHHSPVPTSLEVYPLSALPDLLSWADFLALDLPLEMLPQLRQRLGNDWLPCPAQALIYTPMPCAGLAGCGACAVPARRGWKLACEDGPVFPLDELAW